MDALVLFDIFIQEILPPSSFYSTKYHHLKDTINIFRPAVHVFCITWLHSLYKLSNYIFNLLLITIPRLNISEDRTHINFSSVVKVMW